MIVRSYNDLPWPPIWETLPNITLQYTISSNSTVHLWNLPLHLIHLFCCMIDLFLCTLVLCLCFFSKWLSKKHHCLNSTNLMCRHCFWFWIDVMTQWHRSSIRSKTTLRFYIVTFFAPCNVYTIISLWLTRCLSAICFFASTVCFGHFFCGRIFIFVGESSADCAVFSAVCFEGDIGDCGELIYCIVIGVFLSECMLPSNYLNTAAASHGQVSHQTC